MLGRHGRGAAGERVGQEVVPVGVDAAVRDEQRPGFDLTRVVGDARDLRVATRRGESGGAGEFDELAGQSAPFMR